MTPRSRSVTTSGTRCPAYRITQGSGFAVIAAAVAAVYPEAVVVPSLLVATTDTRHYIDLADNQYRFQGMMIESSQAAVGSRHQRVSGRAEL